MLHTGTCALRTARLTLRPFVLDDAEPMFEGWAKRPEIAHFQRWDAHRSWAETAELVWYWTTLYPDPAFYQWAVTETETGVLIGSASLYQGESRAPDWTRFAPAPEQARWEAGVCLAPSAQGRGLGTELLQALCHHWLDRVGAEFLGISCREDNLPGAHMIEKAGFLYDHPAAFHRYDGSRVDCRVYGMTKKELL